MNELCVATSNVDETKELGVLVGDVVSAGTTVLLIGGLGAGKTALTQGIAAGLGIERRVTSPTFTMVSSHSVDGRRGIALLHHADLYRVGSGIEADDLALAELVEEGAVAVVEWADVAPDVLGSDHVTITLERGDGDDDRLITLVADPSTLDLAMVEARWRAGGGS